MAALGGHRPEIVGTKVHLDSSSNNCSFRPDEAQNLPRTGGWHSTTPFFNGTNLTLAPFHSAALQYSGLISATSANHALVAVGSRSGINLLDR